MTDIKHINATFDDNKYYRLSDGYVDTNADEEDIKELDRRFNTTVPRKSIKIPNRKKSKKVWYVSMTVNPYSKWVFKCDSAKEADIIVERARNSKFKSICRFKHDENKQYTKKGGWSIRYHDKTSDPTWYEDFCFCCGRSY